MHFHDQSYAGSLGDPRLVNTSNYWGADYFWEEVSLASGITRIKRDFFVSEVERVARYALPFVRNISMLMK